MSLSFYTPAYNKSFADDYLLFDPVFEQLLRNQCAGPKCAPKLSQAIAKTQPRLLSADVIETAKDFRVMADLPGVDPKDIEVTLDKNVLTLKSERNHTHEAKTDRVHYLERSYGSVQRQFVLPKSADLQNVDTHFNHGVLTITLPKLAELPLPEKRRLTVNVVQDQPQQDQQKQLEQEAPVTPRSDITVAEQPHTASSSLSTSPSSSAKEGDTLVRQSSQENVEDVVIAA